MDLYRQTILDHYKNPRNFGRAPGISHQETNASCGDDIKLGVVVKGGKITDIGFTGQGCAVAMAGTSMLTEKVKGMKVGKAKKLNEKDMFSLFGGPINPGRKKCATLGLVALKKALEKYAQKD